MACVITVLSSRTIRAFITSKTHFNPFLPHNFVSILSIAVKFCQQTCLGKIFAFKEKNAFPWHLTDSDTSQVVLYI